jgi:hypothetical protein
MPGIGARILKTGIAVALTMFTCNLLKLEPALFGAVSAVVNVQPSVHLTLKAAKEQIIVHVLGVTVGLAFGYLFGGGPLTVGIVTILLISLMVRMNLKSGILMGIVAAIFILTSAPDQFLAHALSRSGVIFTGLVTAMLINVTLWPPKNRQLLTHKLRETNDATVNYFCRAVKDFTRLENQPIKAPAEERKRVYDLIKECRVLAENAQRERHNTGQDYLFLDPNHWLPLAENLLDYTKSMAEKADQIYELFPSRLDRRLKHGANPLSEEFQSILEILERGCLTVTRVNNKLITLVCDQSPAKPEEISESYWENLTAAVDKWHEKFSGSYYLHALIEVGVVAHEIRWASREGKKLLNTILSSGDST